MTVHASSVTGTRRRTLAGRSRSAARRRHLVALIDRYAAGYAVRFPGGGE